jgi:hypothetical protein
MKATALLTSTEPGGPKPSGLFFMMNADQQRRRVRELVVAGMSELLVATLTGWSLSDVRRALAEPQS